MHTFPELIKKIRNKAGLTQSEFAKALGVSVILISMVETGQKEVSKKLVMRIANLLNIHPSSITPFLFASTDMEEKHLSSIEKSFIRWGEKMQEYLIKNRAKRLRKYGK